jgi:hypothetical protein
MLIAPNSSWRGTDGRGMTIEQFAEHVRELRLDWVSRLRGAA